MVSARCQVRAQKGRSRMVPTTKPMATMLAQAAPTTNRKMKIPLWSSPNAWSRVTRASARAISAQARPRYASVPRSQLATRRVCQEIESGCAR